MNQVLYVVLGFALSFLLSTLALLVLDSLGVPSWVQLIGCGAVGFGWGRLWFEVRPRHFR